MIYQSVECLSWKNLFWPGPCFWVPLTPFGRPLIDPGPWRQLKDFWEGSELSSTVKHINIVVFRTCPQVPRVPLKWWHEVLLAPPLPPRRGSGWREFHKLPQMNLPIPFALGRIHFGLFSFIFCLFKHCIPYILTCLCMCVICVANPGEEPRQSLGGTKDSFGRPS